MSSPAQPPDRSQQTESDARLEGSDRPTSGNVNTPSAADQVSGDMELRDTLDDPGSYQSNHGATGFGSDDDHADPDDAKVQGRSRRR
jgi:hypothetical protein